MLEHFMFPPDMQYTYVSKLSGGGGGKKKTLSTYCSDEESKLSDTRQALQTIWIYLL